jgi:ADP-ribose pyrophosphatase YjhB (NUDIX family)
VADSRAYPQRPYLAVSAAIVRAGRLLVVRRARMPAQNLYTFPGGGVETGETLNEAVIREVREETQLAIIRDRDGAVERHFVILCFAARWLSGEPVLNEELDDARWVTPAELGGIRTTEGLAEIAAAAIARLDEAKP